MLDAALDEVHCQELFELPEPTTTLDLLTFDPDLVHVSLIKVAVAFLEFRSAFATTSCVVALYSDSKLFVSYTNKLEKVHLA